MKLPMDSNISTQFYLTSVLGIPTTNSSLFRIIVSNHPTFSIFPLVPSEKRTSSPYRIWKELCFGQKVHRVEALLKIKQLCNIPQIFYLINEV